MLIIIFTTLIMLTILAIDTNTTYSCTSEDIDDVISRFFTVVCDCKQLVKNGEGWICL